VEVDAGLSTEDIDRDPIVGVGDLRLGEPDANMLNIAPAATISGCPASLPRKNKPGSPRYLTGTRYTTWS
jgi:hypothetical protein